MTQYRLAKEIGVPQRRISEIVAGTRAVTVDTDHRLARFFGTSEGLCTGFQADFERALAKESIADVLARIQRFAQGEASA